MSRIALTFAELHSAGRKGFIPFVSAGDPDLETSLEIVHALAELGSDIIELGVPFSDPMADGPTIQASSMRALANGVRLDDVIGLSRRFREKSDVPIVLFSYLNPLHRYGLERLARDAAAAGIDGVLVTDAVDEEAAEIGSLLRANGLDLISLIAPTTSDERLAKIAANASGFLYAVSRAGVTGARAETSSSAEELVRRARKFTDLPVAVGFGISTREQIEEVWEYADAAVVGSAIVAEIERSIPSGNVPERVRSFVGGLLPEVANAGTEN
ncbi:MAG: tryptophan synthase subunit alpha [Acidobacteria bacterium]|nr:tryptophan synthase subunit alpha [Acidobacteriota bacterium]